jgi:hypothetical protein
MASFKQVNVTTLKALVLALTVGFIHEASANTYRYIDDRGRTVHGSTVPPQFVKNGYEVLNDNGQVIQVVPRALSAEERAAQESVRAQQLAEEAALREQQEADSLLMRLYRSPEDIERKRDERVVLLDGQLTAVVAALVKLEAEVTTTQESIDRLTAAGNQIPPQTQETLRIRQQERDRMLAQRDRLVSDKAAAAAEAERDMKRLSELMGLSEEPAAE